MNLPVLRPLFIVDLDGTIALIDHRRHLVMGEKKKDHRAFFAACVDDLPNIPVLTTIRMLRLGGAEIWIWSARSDEVRRQTLHWLAETGIYVPGEDGEFAHQFRMRAAGDCTPDAELKTKWLAELSAEDRERIVAVFDDRDSVVAMWRAAGIACFQVAPGEF